MKQKHFCVFFVVSTFSFLLLAQPRVSARRPPQLSVFGRQGTWCPRPVRVEDFLFLPLIFLSELSSEVKARNTKTQLPPDSVLLWLSHPSQHCETLSSGSTRCVRGEKPLGPGVETHQNPNRDLRDLLLFLLKIHVFITQSHFFYFSQPNTKPKDFSIVLHN